MVESDLAYIAGLIDGEGTIGACIRNPNSRMRELRPQIVPYVSLAMCDESIIKWLAEVTKVGNVYFSASRNAKHNSSWSWRPTVRKIVPILKLLLPYLKVKKRQAELFIELIEIRINSKRTTINRERQFQIVAELKSLNKRGR